LKSGGSFVKDGAVVGHQGGHISLGVDGKEVNTRSSLASGTFEDDLLGINVNASGNSGDESGSAAGSGSVVNLGHFCFGCFGVKLRSRWI